LVRRASADRTTAAAHKDADAASRGDGSAPQSAHQPVAEAVSVEKCINCRFYDRRHAKPLDGKAPLWGQCRRHAPQLNPNPINAKAYLVEGIWPLVRDDDWCGEWKIVVHVSEEWEPEASAADELPPLPSRERRSENALGDD
jgi:hypothetical protein